MPTSPAMPIEAAAGARSSTAAFGWWPLAGIGAGVFTFALLATLPARVVLPAGTDAAGTVWHGEAALGGGNVAAWNWSPGASLLLAGIGFEWHLDGTGTALRGAAAWAPFGGVTLGDVSGRAGWPLVALAAPGLPLVCDFGLGVSLGRVRLDRRDPSASGTMTGGPGTCTGRSASAPRTVPRIFVALQGSTGTITPWANRAAGLATMSVAGGTFRVHTTAAGAALIPGSTGPSDLEIEL